MVTVAPYLRLMPTASSTRGLTLRVSTTGAAEPGRELCTEALKVAV